jgi:hypothetical protein
VAKMLDLNRRPLLHNDSNFHPMARHLGLIELST